MNVRPWLFKDMCVWSFTVDTALLSANGIFVGSKFKYFRSGSNCSKTHKTFSIMLPGVNRSRWFCLHPSFLKDSCHPECSNMTRKRWWEGLKPLYSVERGKPDQPKIHPNSAFLPRHDCLGMDCVFFKQDPLASGDFHLLIGLWLDVLASFHEALPL